MSRWIVRIAQEPLRQTSADLINNNNNNNNNNKDNNNKNIKSLLKYSTQIAIYKLLVKVYKKSY